MRKFAIIVLLSGLAFGQRPQTIHQKVFENIIVARNSSPVRNMGAVSHLLMVQLTSQAGYTCSGGAANIGLEASYDQTTWTPIGSQLTGITGDANGNLIAMATAQGAYPYVRVAVRSFDTTNCQLTAWYTGSQGPQSIVALESQPTERWTTQPATYASFDLAGLASGSCSGLLLNASGPGRLLYFGLAIPTITVGSGTPVLTLQISTDGGSWTTYEALTSGAGLPTGMRSFQTENSGMSNDVLRFPWLHDFSTSLQARFCLSGGTYSAGVVQYGFKYATR